MRSQLVDNIERKQPVEPRINLSEHPAPPFYAMVSPSPPPSSALRLLLLLRLPRHPLPTVLVRLHHLEVILVHSHLTAHLEVAPLVRAARLGVLELALLQELATQEAAVAFQALEDGQLLCADVQCDDEAAVAG